MTGPVTTNSADGTMCRVQIFFYRGAFYIEFEDAIQPKWLFCGRPFKPRPHSRGGKGTLEVKIRNITSTTTTQRAFIMKNRLHRGTLRFFSITNVFPSLFTLRNKNYIHLYLVGFTSEARHLARPLAFLPTIQFP